MPNCKRSLYVAAVFVLCILIPLPALAELPYEVLGNGFTGRPVVLRDDIVLESDGYLNAIRDFSDPGSPAWIGWYNNSFSLHWSQAFADGNLLVGLNTLFGSGPVGFNVIDFARPDSPVEMSVVGSILAETGWLDGRTLLLAGEQLVVTYDLTDAAAPALESIFVIGAYSGNRWPAAAGGHLFLIDGDSALRRLDIADPLYPIDLGTLPVSYGRVDALAGAGEVLYLLVAGEDGDPHLDLVAWDVGGGSGPVETARLRLVTGDGATGRSLVLDGGLLLAGADDDLVQAFDVSDPAAPEPGWTLRHDASQVVMSDHAIFVTAADTLLVYGRTAADETPGEPVRRPIPPAMDAVFGKGPHQIAQSRTDRSLLVPIDAADPTHPTVGEPIDTGLDGTFRWADGIGLMEKGETEFQLLDCSDPWEPRPAGSVSKPTPEADAGVHPGGVLLVRYPAKQMMLDIWDVSDPDQPRLAASIAEYDPRYCDGQWLICGMNDWERPRVYALDENLQPTLVSRLMSRLGNAYRYQVLEDFVYAFGVADDWITPMMEVHKLGPNSNLVLEMQLERTVHREDLFGGLLFLQGGYDCFVFDVSDPVSPYQIGKFPNPLGASFPSFAVNGDVATISSALITVRVTTSAAPVDPAPAPASAVRLGPARPNPFNPHTSISFTVDRERDLTVAVYDARGRLVDELVSGHFEKGEHTLMWDAQSNGAAAASGVYFVRVYGPGVEAVQAVTMLK